MSRIISLLVMFSVSLLVACCSAPESKTDLQVEENKTLVRRDFEEIWIKGNLDVIDEIYDANFVKYSNDDKPKVHGPEELKQTATVHRTTFPDMQFAIEDMVAEGDKVAVRWTFTGTHKGKLVVGIPPTGLQATMTGIAIYRITGGKIMEIWVNSDVLGLWLQLGVIPPIGEGEE